jgi:adenosylcobinamide-phosphate synthase
MSLPLLTALALLLEAAAGYPPALYAAIGHPVTWLGALIAWMDRVLNRETAPSVVRRIAGVAAVVVLVGVTLAVTVPLQLLLDRPFAMLLLVPLAASLPAQRSLNDHVASVAADLERGLEAGRRSVGLIVGRNTSVLDEAAVARAAIESLAENTSDGVVAPAFWMAALGLPGAAVYKAINTADSMIGHKTPRHRAFGWAAARLDDLVNLPASRLTALLFAVAALVTPGASAGRALRVAIRDARKHRSPNAGWPEAAMAGALGLKLNGPRRYGDDWVHDSFMGDGRREATPADIRAALRLYRRAMAVQWGLVAAAAAVLWHLGV